MLNWIIQNFFEVSPLLDDHQTEQTRVANPLLNWLRNVALLVKKNSNSKNGFAQAKSLHGHRHFLSAVGIALMGIDNFGDEKAYAIERFPDRTKSAVTDWAKEQIAAAWNGRDNN
jgi:hypothetical protein